jgi:hypothetical protein
MIDYKAQDQYKNLMRHMESLRGLTYTTDETPDVHFTILSVGDDSREGIFVISVASLDLSGKMHNFTSSSSVGLVLKHSLRDIRLDRESVTQLTVRLTLDLRAAAEAGIAMP